MTNRENYTQQKIKFLDSLQPDDLRNGGSFNQAEVIIDQLSKALQKAMINGEDPTNFIQKAVEQLFRENSPAISAATELLQTYLKEK